MVKYRIAQNKLFLYFSDKINPGTLTAAAIVLQESGRTSIVKQAGFPNNPFELVIETDHVIVSQEVALAFKVLPAGVNGKSVTYWASAIPVAGHAAAHAVPAGMEISRLP